MFLHQPKTRPEGTFHRIRHSFRSTDKPCRCLSTSYMYTQTLRVLTLGEDHNSMVPEDWPQSHPDNRLEPGSAASSCCSKEF